jgi:hypothetical protein
VLGSWCSRGGMVGGLVGSGRLGLGSVGRSVVAERVQAEGARNLCADRVDWQVMQSLCCHLAIHTYVSNFV